MENFYNQIANNYKNIAKNKKQFLAGVNKILISKLRSRKEILDIGSGDGLRIEIIKKKLKNSRFTALESSKEMCKLFKKNSKIKLFNLDMKRLDQIHTPKFDAITCLWNVFGHLKNNSERVKVLKKIKKKMYKSSIFLTDVNNRHNALSYGYIEVVIRVLIDYFFYNEKRGDAKYDIKINNKIIRANGHLFTYKEFSNILDEAGFKIIKTYSINYNSGKIMNSLFHGQLLFFAKIK